MSWKSKNGRWAIKYDNCISCGESKYPHAAKGLCDLCYKRKDFGYQGRSGCWSIKHNSCIKCGSTSRHHEAHGLCYLCYIHIKKPLKGGRKITSRIISCPQCGIEFKMYQYRIKASKKVFCSKACFRKYNQGKNHFWYRDGISGWRHYPKEFKQVRNTIRQRDNYKCKLCGVPEEECIERLSVHHINYNKHDLRSENLISLCKSCHAKTGKNREEWIRYFDVKQFIEAG